MLYNILITINQFLQIAVRKVNTIAININNIYKNDNQFLQIALRKVNTNVKIENNVFYPTINFY
jgi:type IV secretory pathway VirB3-like protein